MATGSVRRAGAVWTSPTTRPAPRPGGRPPPRRRPRGGAPRRPRRAPPPSPRRGPGGASPQARRSAGDAARLERLYGEVRMARQVSHPAVCRVWDIGEAEGQPFLSMEFVDGENLASLLRRIGRLPGDKALEIAQQVTAGLA